MFDSKQMPEMAEKFAQEMSKMMPAQMPKMKFNKTGYEIRANMLEMAQNQMWQDYHAKFGAWEATVKKEGDEMVTTVEFPESPSTEMILETANKFYDFVNKSQ